ncbi:hypothetical protein [Microbacterium sp. BK668]|uniref:hypothetical protein n=1 Tax=Microbacterium sp. BK668 TaxID=2512118 RepID=UPI00105F2F16|nr:hypothetical protein [Microbacterium sp. BK668]TDN92248.1 hypothetical protein EV279_1766 [Microbacterium sp. BK668]
MASSADPFLPIQGPDAVRREHEPVQRADFDLEDEREPDFFPGEPGDDDVDEPPVSDGPFRTPTGARVDPADDL